MAFIPPHEKTHSSLCLYGIDLACLFQAFPQQVQRWKDSGLLKQNRFGMYDPMRAIIAVANWEGRGRTPAAVTWWRERLGEKPSRKAFLQGMAFAFDLVAKIRARRHGRGGGYVEFYEDEEAGADDAEQAAEAGAEQATPQPDTPPQGTFSECARQSPLP